MKLKLFVKSKFVSSILGTLSVFLGIGFILPLSNFSVYITSYINLKDTYVTMHYGLFINLVYSFANTFSSSLGGYLENLLGFYFTIIVGMAIVFLANLAFIFQQNFWLCYTLSLILGIGTGISTSLLGKNLTFYYPDKKGIICGVLGFGTMIISAIFALTGEKIINFDGKTLDENEDFYPPEISERTYLYFLLGEFVIPIGLILALLLIYEYKAENNQEDKSNSEEKKEKEPGEEEKITIKTEENNEKTEEKKTSEEKKNETEENNEKTKETIDNENNEEKKNETEENNEKIEENNEKTKETKDNERTSEEKKSEDVENQSNKKISKQKLFQVIKSLRYWRIILFSFLMNIPISFMISTGRTFGALIGINGNALQFAGIIQVVAVLILGPILGILVDKKGPLLLLRIIAIISIPPALLLTFFMSYTFVFIFCFILYVLNLIALSVCFGPFIMEVYGIQESVVLGGIINGFSGFSGILCTLCAFGFSLVCDNEKKCLKSRYGAMYLISGICAAFSAILLFFEKLDKFKYEKIEDEEILNNNVENKNESLIPDETKGKEE